MTSFQSAEENVISPKMAKFAPRPYKILHESDFLRLCPMPVVAVSKFVAFRNSDLESLLNVIIRGLEQAHNKKLQEK